MNHATSATTIASAPKDKFRRQAATCPFTFFLTVAPKCLLALRWHGAQLRWHGVQLFGGESVVVAESVCHGCNG